MRVFARDAIRPLIDAIPMLRAGLDSPVGPLTVLVKRGAVVALEWEHCAVPDSDPILTKAVAQLRAYFDGELRAFDLPLSPDVSAFQKGFGEVLCGIPFGETRTYGQLAKQMNRPAQAIGQACGANPIAIIIPCHRVLAQCGLGGYSGAGGIEAKVKLLRLEGAASLLI